MPKAQTEHDKEAFLWKVIGRYDTYYSSINAKASALIAFNVFVVTSIALKWSDFANWFSQPWARVVAGAMLFVAVGAAFVSLIATWTIVSPFLGSPKEPSKYHSRVFFEHVAEHGDPAVYFANIQALTADAAAEDLALQAHALAKGLKKKFAGLKVAVGAIIFVQLPAHSEFSSASTWSFGFSPISKSYEHHRSQSLNAALVRALLARC